MELMAAEVAEYTSANRPSCAIRRCHATNQTDGTASRPSGHLRHVVHVPADPTHELRRRETRPLSCQSLHPPVMALSSLPERLLTTEFLRLRRAATYRKYFPGRWYSRACCRSYGSCHVPPVPTSANHSSILRSTHCRNSADSTTSHNHGSGSTDQTMDPRQLRHSRARTTGCNTADNSNRRSRDSSADSCSNRCCCSNRCRTCPLRWNPHTRHCTVALAPDRCHIGHLVQSLTEYSSRQPAGLPDRQELPAQCAN